jgi:hypothetical protein
MIPRPESDEEIHALDRALEGLAHRRPTGNDPALVALADLARAIDARADALDGQPDPALVSRTRPATPPRLPDNRPRRARPVTRRRLGWSVAVSCAAAVVAVALVAILPVNGSPNSPLYPLHRLIFQPATPTATQDIRVKLASASATLDHAAGRGAATHADLDKARQLLAEASDQLPQVTDPGTRSELQNEVSQLQQRADQLGENIDQDGQPNVTPAPGHNQQQGGGDDQRGGSGGGDPASTAGGQSGIDQTGGPSSADTDQHQSAAAAR